MYYPEGREKGAVIQINEKKNKNVRTVEKILNKNLIAVFALVVLVACQKKSTGDGKYCWRCHVTGGIPYSERDVDTCWDNENFPPAFFDANNNPMDEFCTRIR
jgi:hypothetical protein